MGEQTLSLSGVESQSADEPRFKVLGVSVDAVQIPGAIARMERWISGRSGCHFIAVTGMHGVTEAQHDECFKKILNSADMVVPDGMPLVWLGTWHGHALKRRVYGPELMQTFCGLSGPKYRHYFYGGMPGVPSLLAGILRDQYAISVVGEFSPPFRALTAAEDDEIVGRINDARPDVLWIGLSTPKQERWMYEHREKLRVPVVVGVGAAFDLNSGRLKQAPPWMQERGLEWAFRLVQEPRRLWKRYLINGSEFLCYVAAELLGLRRFD